MEEEDDPNFICSLLEQATQEVRQENEAESSSTSQSRVSLSIEIMQKLCGIFGASSSQYNVDGTLWEELSHRRVPLGDLVNGLVGTMERGGTTGVQAAHVYLGLLLVPESPSYSLFSPLAFQVLLRCVLNACKPTGPPTVEFKTGSNNRKKSQKKGKRVRDVEDQNDEETSESAGSGVATEDITLLLSRLRTALQVVSLKDHQGTLKTVIEFLSELPHVVADLQEPSTEERGHKLRKGSSLKGGPDCNQNTRLVFCLLEDMLDLAHGDRGATSVLVLKLLTPSLLLMRNSQQKSNIRTAAIEFVVKTMLGKGDEGIHTAVVALTRYLCFKAPEKTDARAQAVETILILVKALSISDQHSFLKFVCKLSRGKPRHRLLALDLCAALFTQMSDPLGLEETDVANGDSGCSWGIGCLEAILQRCSDKVPTVRARALMTLAQVIELLSAEVRQRMYLQELFAALGTTTAGNTSTEGNTSWDTPFQDIAAMGSKNLFTVSGARNPTPAVLSPGAHRGDFGSLMRKRCSDDKAAVRKAALVLMTKSTILLGSSPDDQMLRAMGFSCSDQMLSIRKAALSALSEVTRRFSKSKKVVTEWLQSALPLAIDNESSIQEETVSHFKELCLDPITSISVLKVSSKQLATALLEKSDEPEQQALPPGVLHFLTGLAEQSDSAFFIKRVCARLGKAKGLRGSVVTALQNIISASEELLRKKRHVSDHKRVQSISQGAWFLLSELSCFLPKVVSWDFLRTHWQLLGKQEGPSRLDEDYTPVPYSSCTKKQFRESASWAASRVHLLQTIANVALELPPDASADLVDELLRNLEDFSMHPAEVGAHVSALTILCKRKAATDEEGEELVAEWVRQLLHKAERILKKHLSDQKDDDFQTPGHVSGRRSNLRKKPKESITISQVVTAIFTIGATVLVCPFSNTGDIVTLLEKLITVKEPAVNAQIWVTLGKLCLADDKLAKRLIPVFVQELESTSSAATRNNIMITLTDFCVRYTALIEGYIPKLTKSLRDECEIVRRQTFVLLARLLQRDYVKWRGMLFHRFLLALVDESPKICQMADFLFGNILKTKAPLLAYNSFVEAIFALNDYQGQSSGSNVLHSSESERHLFSLRGNSQAAVNKRMHIYITLLKQMNPEHLLATSAKLCAEILAGAADGLIDITSSCGKCVVEDALRILASKEMRLAGNKTASNTAEQMEEEDGAAAFAAMRGKVVTQFAKKNLVQNAIPIFIELKRLLEKSSSPLLGALMDCLRNMLKDYKSEIDEILVGDKQLQKELMYDMQKHETAKARSKVESFAAKVVQPDEQHPEDGTKAKANGRTAPSAKAMETPARVTWLDQTPRLRGVHGSFASPKGPSRNDGGVLSPRSLVGAAGDMAAAATAASVLQEAAAGKATPLRAMSLPRLRRGVHFQQDPGENQGVDSATRRLDK